MNASELRSRVENLPRDSVISLLVEVSPPEGEPDLSSARNRIERGRILQEHFDRTKTPVLQALQTRYPNLEVVNFMTHSEQLILSAPVSDWLAIADDPELPFRENIQAVTEKTDIVAI